MITLILNERWNYCTQSEQCSHELPQDTAKSSITFEYKLYKLCGLLGVTN